MPEHSGPFVWITALLLLTIILVAAMKYLAHAWQGRSAATATADIQALRGDLGEIKSRLAAIEKILREVE